MFSLRGSSLATARVEIFGQPFFVVGTIQEIALEIALVKYTGLEVCGLCAQHHLFGGGQRVPRRRLGDLTGKAERRVDESVLGDDFEEHAVFLALASLHASARIQKMSGTRGSNETLEHVRAAHVRGGRTHAPKGK